MNCDKEALGGASFAPDSEDEEALLEPARRHMRGELLARGIEIFRLGLSLRDLGGSTAGSGEVEAARRQFAEHVHKVTKQRGKSLQELHLKTQILCVLLDSDMPELSFALAKSIRDDAGALCQRHARSGRHEV
jgi:hypothetical protein